MFATLSLSVLLTLTTLAYAQTEITETLYVESTTDTDNDGLPDRIYVTVKRPASARKLSTIFHISPYALGGTEVPMHRVDMEKLPQDVMSLFQNISSSKSQSSLLMKEKLMTAVSELNAPQYARVSAHSVGTGNSTGCPTVGDMSETLGAKAVIDWLNGRARGYSTSSGKEVVADWANGHVGMTGTSYDGTLPIMVATTGVEGLKAIIPVAAISNWYDYYRANGLVVNPGGYIGEDADILGYYIVRKGACQDKIKEITRIQGREHGDFTPFWQERDYLPMVKNIKAATFIIHGQNDWNVKQKHAIQLWEALEGVAPRRMFLHKGGHSSTTGHDVPRKVQAWFDHFLEGVDNGITQGPQVEVELVDGTLVQQEEWPHEKSQEQRLFFAAGNTLSAQAGPGVQQTLTDSGSTTRLETLIANPQAANEGRLIFLTTALEKDTLLTGTSRVTLELAILNRTAANVTVALVEYDRFGRGKIITRGWADPQNARDITRGERLIPTLPISLSFTLEPKQYRLSRGSKLGVVLASTDHEYTLRPRNGTQLQFTLGSASFIDLFWDAH